MLLGRGAAATSCRAAGLCRVAGFRRRAAARGGGTTEFMGTLEGGEGGTAPALPLEGVRVLEFTHAVMGPTAGA